MTSEADDLSLHPLWPKTEAELLRAERLLQRSVQQLASEEHSQQQHLARVGLELERVLAPLQRLSSGLGGLIEAMAAERQDNLSQRWQGQLQELLLPLDEACLQLQELLVQLDHPSQLARMGEGSTGRDTVQRQKLQQLLALRQRQVLQHQAELTELRQRLFAQQSSGLGDAQSAEIDSEREIDDPALPSIFGSESP